VRGVPPAATSSSVISTVVGTPSATPEALPKLFVMSSRTTPLSVRTFGPLDPSPGNGPAVSSGISDVVPADDSVSEDVAVPDAPVVVSPSEPPQAATMTEPTPPANSPTPLRRETSRGRSNSRPRSWSSMVRDCGEAVMSAPSCRIL
jgi:hypothetical protein